MITNLKRIITFSLVAAIFISLVGEPVSAYKLATRADLQLDEALTERTLQQYAYPTTIAVTQIERYSQWYVGDSQEWIDHLYYYYITRLGFSDIPYNYIVDDAGVVYETHAGWDESGGGNEGVVPELISEDGVILVGYLSLNDQLTPAAATTFKDLFESISAKYGIPSRNVKTISTSVVRGTGSDPSKLRATDRSDGVFATAVKTAVATSRLTNTASIRFDAKVDKVTVVKSAQIGSEVDVSVEMTNSGANPWYIGGESYYIRTADGQDSPIALNGEWDSFDIVGALEGDILLPGEKTTVEFKIFIPLRPETYKESFVISQINDTQIRGSNFEIELSGVKGDLQLVEITETETGFLNVRKDAAFNGAQIGQVDVGKVYITTGQQDGWIKIIFDGDQEGWVLGRYVRRI